MVSQPHPTCPRRHMQPEQRRKTQSGGSEQWRDGSQQTLKYVERVMGIEPTYQAWEARVLPLNYTRMAQSGG